MSLAPTITLNNGQKIPAIGYGTFSGIGLEDTIKKALDVGYRLFDTAWVYKNEVQVGKSLNEEIAKGKIKREEIVVISKLWNTKHDPKEVIPAVKRSLADLGFDYVDLYLVHWPFACKPPKDEYELLDFEEADIPLEETWKAMEEVVKQGFAKGIGVSNFNSEQLKRILKVAEIKPVVNEVECNPYVNQKKLTAFCKENGIEVIAYAPFWSPSSPWIDKSVPSVFTQPIVQELAKKYGKSAGQIVLKYLVQLGNIPIPKTDNADRLKQNFEVFDFSFTPEEIAKLDTLNQNKRCCPFDPAQNFKEYPFAIEF